MDVKALREPTCVSPVIEWVVDCEKYGGCWQVMTYAAVFFATIVLFLTVVGIPLILLATYDYGQQKLAAQVENQPVPENPLQAEVTRLTQQNSSLTSRNSELSDLNTRQETELGPLRRLQETFTSAQGDQGRTLADFQQQLQSAQHALSEKDQYIARLGGILSCPSDQIETSITGLKDDRAELNRRISDLDKLANERLQELEGLKTANRSLEDRIAKIQMPPPPARQPFDTNVTPRRVTRSASFDSPRPTWQLPGKGGGTFPPAPASPRTPARTLNGSAQ